MSMRSSYWRAFKTSMLHPGRFEHGPLEKLGFLGLTLGFSIAINFFADNNSF